MTEQRKIRLARFILSRLLELATGMKLLWLDMDSGRALFKLEPTSEQVTELLASMPQGA